MLFLKCLRKRNDPAVLYAAICSLGHLSQPSAVQVIRRYLDHPDEDVRFAVTFALGCFPNEPTSVSGLMQLARDHDSDVRDWAVFGFGMQGSADSVEIRELLFSCLHDEDVDIREEAAVGLAIRQDERVLPFLMQAFGNEAVGERITDAAAWLLGFGYEPPKWDASKFKTELKTKFPATRAAQSE